MGDEGHPPWALEHEWGFLHSSAAEIPELDLLSQAALHIGFAQERLPLAGLVLDHQLLVCLSLLGSMGYRTARAAGLLIASGYASEAFPQLRRLAEIAARARFLAADETGQRAGDWLDRRGPRPARLVGQEHWESLSPGAHSDAGHIEWMSDRESDRLFYVFACRDSRDGLIALTAAAEGFDLAEVLHLAARLSCEAIEAAREVLGRSADLLIQAEPDSVVVPLSSPPSHEQHEDAGVLRLPI